MNIENNYILRQVSEFDLKACFICYKLTKWVLITKSQSDFFYTCFNHLEDRGFATLTYDPHSKPLSMPKVDETSTSTEKNHHFEEQTNGSNPRKDRVEKSEGDHESPGHIFDSNGSAKVCDVNPIETRSPSSKSSPSISSGAKMSGRQYVLHRDIFQMRLQFHANLAAQRKTRQLLNSGKGLPSPPSKPLP